MLGQNSKMGGDRFIPVRNNRQMDVASFLLTKKQPFHANTTLSPEMEKAWSISLNGYNVNGAKMLHFGGRAASPPEGCQSGLKVHTRRPVISPTPDRILDAPELENDFYLNLLDWSSHNVLAVGLHNSVHLWDASGGGVICSLKQERNEGHVCSLAWSKEGSYLAVGTSGCSVQLWDVENQKRLWSTTGHAARVGSLSWNGRILSSGSRSGDIHHHDVRVAEHHLRTRAAHSQEVCGLHWSPDGRYLASGGGDGAVCVWPRVQEGSMANRRRAIYRWSEHRGAVKALAWCPWQPKTLASGGGTNDRRISLWNVNTGSCMSSVDTQSQVSSLVFAPNYKELVSTHGRAHHSVVIWKYPTLSKAVELHGHSDRVLNATLSPDGSTVATLSADETVCLWKSFELDPVQKKRRERMAASTSSRLFQSIR